MTQQVSPINQRLLIESAARPIRGDITRSSPLAPFRMSLSQVLPAQNAVAGVQAKQQENLSLRIGMQLSQFVKEFDAVQRHGERLAVQVPSSVRPMMQLQLLVNRLSLETQLLTRAGDAISSTVRQVQQMGSR